MRQRWMKKILCALCLPREIFTQLKPFLFLFNRGMTMRSKAIFTGVIENKT